MKQTKGLCPVSQCWWWTEVEGGDEAARERTRGKEIHISLQRKRRKKNLRPASDHFTWINTCQCCEALCSSYVDAHVFVSSMRCWLMGTLCSVELLYFFFFFLIEGAVACRKQQKNRNSCIVVVGFWTRCSEANTRLKARPAPHVWVARTCWPGRKWNCNTDARDEVVSQQRLPRCLFCLVKCSSVNFCRLRRRWFDSVFWLLLLLLLFTTPCPLRGSQARAISRCVSFISGLSCFSKKQNKANKKKKKIDFVLFVRLFFFSYPLPPAKPPLGSAVPAT